MTQLNLPTTWEVPVEAREVDHTTCPYIGGEIRLSQRAFSKISALMDHFNVEWLGYLMGDWKGEVLTIKDLNVPNQKTTAASVSDVEDAPPRGSIGVIHSHVAMGAFFSGTDDTWINSNHNVSIVVSKKAGALEFKSQVRKRVSCGALMLMNLPVKLVEVNQQSWLGSVIDRVKSVVYVPRVVQDTQLLPAKYMGVAGYRGAIDQDLPLNPEEKAIMQAAYELCVKAIADAEGGAPGVLAALGALDDEVLENAIEFIDVNQGSAVIAELLEQELDKRIQEAAKSVGVSDYTTYGV